jgi:transposase
VAQNFLPCDREQELLLPPSLREWLPEDHLAWFVIDAVEALELEGFYADYRADGWGRPAHDPAMMLALLMYAYAVGERSSRAIERRCHEDVAFRVICANHTPDHATIARFRARHERALAATFTQVLALCAKAGLASIGLVALDGSLVAANASAAQARSYRAIGEEVEAILEEAARADAAEDERLGEARGEQLPPELAERRSRLARLRRCAQELEAEQAAEESRHQANLAWRAQWEAEHGRKLAGRKPTPPDPGGLAARTINTTDPDARPMVRRGAKSVQGDNVQVLASPEQVIVATEVTQAASDSGQLGPMVATALAEIGAAGSGSGSGPSWPMAATGARPPSPRCAPAGSTCSCRPPIPGAPPRARSHPARGNRPATSTPSSPRPRARRSTGAASRSSSRSSPRRSSCGAWVAFSTGGWRPAAPSGG